MWHPGQAFVARPRARTLRARADVVVRDVAAASLSVALDNTPPRHANIIGWPEEKSAQKLYAQQLAARATLKLAPVEVSGTTPLSP